MKNREVIEYKDRNSRIEAFHINIHPSVVIGENVNITCRHDVRIGAYSNLGSNFTVNAEELRIGEHFFHTTGFVAGGGGSQFRAAKLFIGDKCVVHNNYLNLARSILLADGVGLSPDVQIITHGFWNSPFEGNPINYGEVVIYSGTVIGQRSMILPGVMIAENCVVGAQSLVSSNLEVPNAIYAGNPATLKRLLKPLSEDKKRQVFDQIVADYKKTCYQYRSLPLFKEDYPNVTVDGLTINLLTGEFDGRESKDSDDFRDFLRRHGIKVYTTRPFGDLSKR